MDTIIDTLKKSLGRLATYEICEIIRLCDDELEERSDQYDDMRDDLPTGMEIE